LNLATKQVDADIYSSNNQKMAVAGMLLNIQFVIERQTNKPALITIPSMIFHN